MHYEYGEIARRAEAIGYGHRAATIVLESGDSAVAPWWAGKAFRGPGRVRYLFDDHGWDAFAGAGVAVSS
ncbi:hypothetical protein [Nocardia sp. NPDC004722]